VGPAGFAEGFRWFCWKLILVSARFAEGCYTFLLNLLKAAPGCFCQANIYSLGDEVEYFSEDMGVSEIPRICMGVQNR